MKKKRFIILAIFTLLVLVLFGFIAINSQERFNILFKAPTPIPTVGVENPEVIENPTPISSINIEVLAPRDDDEVEAGFIVNGNARVFENTVNIRLLDSEGEILVETFSTANAPDIGQFGPFEIEIEYETEDSKGTLEVFQISPKDGEEVDKVTIPLLFI